MKPTFYRDKTPRPAYGYGSSSNSPVSVLENLGSTFSGIDFNTIKSGLSQQRKKKDRA